MVGQSTVAHLRDPAALEEVKLFEARRRNHVKRTHKKLVLSKETLRELAKADLFKVVGGGITRLSCFPDTECISECVTCGAVAD